jgi:Xaa-Pro aminopeptidase
MAVQPAWGKIEFIPSLATTDNAILFVNPQRVSQHMRAQLGQEVQLRLYDTFIPISSSSGLTFRCVQVRLDTNGFCAILGWGDVLTDEKTSLAVSEAIGLSCINIAHSPIADLKAIKNAKEIEGFPREAYQRRRRARAILVWLD